MNVGAVRSGPFPGSAVNICAMDRADKKPNKERKAEKRKSPAAAAAVPQLAPAQGGGHSKGAKRRQRKAEQRRKKSAVAASVPQPAPAKGGGLSKSDKRRQRRAILANPFRAPWGLIPTLAYFKVWLAGTRNFHFAHAFRIVIYYIPKF